MTLTHRATPRTAGSIYLSETQGVWIWRGVVLSAFLLIWEWSAGRLVDELLISRPTAVAAKLVAWTVSGRLPRAILETLGVVVSGIVCGAVTGLLVGLLFGVNRVVRQLFGPALTALFALPKVALIPLFILWFGLGPLQRTVFTSVVVFFFVFLATMEGVANVPRALERMMQLMGASTARKLFVLYLPATTSWVLSGLRVATPYAVVATIGAEVVASREGLGFLARSSGAALDTAGTIASIVASMGIAIATSAATNFAERMLSHRYSL